MKSTSDPDDGSRSDLERRAVLLLENYASYKAKWFENECQEKPRRGKPVVRPTVSPWEVWAADPSGVPPLFKHRHDPGLEGVETYTKLDPREFEIGRLFCPRQGLVVSNSADEKNAWICHLSGEEKRFEWSVEFQTDQLRRGKPVFRYAQAARLRTLKTSLTHPIEMREFLTYEDEITDRHVASRRTVREAIQRMLLGAWADRSAPAPGTIVTLGDGDATQTGIVVSSVRFSGGALASRNPVFLVLLDSADLSSVFDLTSAAADDAGLVTLSSHDLVRYDHLPAYARTNILLQVLREDLKPVGDARSRIAKIKTLVINRLAKP